MLQLIKPAMTQQIYDAYVFPHPPTIDSTFFAFINSFATLTTSRDSITIETNNAFLEVEITINDYYHSSYLMTATAVFDTINLSSIIQYSGQYKIIYYLNNYYPDQDTLIKTDTAIYHIYVTTDIQEYNDIEKIHIYPNPVNDNLHIDIEENSILEIINAQGQIIETKSLTEKSNSIDLSNIASGVYTLRIKTDKGIAMRKLIKQ